MNRNTTQEKISAYVRGLREMRSFEAKYPVMPQAVTIARLARQISLAFKNITGDAFGHAHFIYNGKKEHLILVCDGQGPEKIVAKGRHCKKGECLRWERSEFSALSPERAFLQFLPNVRRIIIEHPAIRKTWHSFRQFQVWLNQVCARA